MEDLPVEALKILIYSQVNLSFWVEPFFPIKLQV